jgi:hypothetical protein
MRWLTPSSIEILEKSKSARKDVQDNNAAVMIDVYINIVMIQLF